MKLLTIFTALLIALNVNSQGQYDCDNYPAVSIGYLTKKSIVVSGEYYTEMGLTASIGVAANKPDKYPRKNLPDSIGNSLDIFVSAGYRLLRIDYTFSWFINAGFNMGDVNSLSPLVSTKLLFPIKNTRFSTSVEPLYIFGRGLTGKLSFHFKL